MSEGIIRDAPTVQDAIARIAGASATVTQATPVSGGCIAGGTRIDLSDGSSWFVKRSSRLPRDTFSAEADGLAALAAGPGPRVPRVVAVGDEKADEGFVIMEWIEQGRRRLDFDAVLGRQLAELHRRRLGDRYGFERDNYIGSTPQPNTWTHSWHEFFRVHRLGYQVRLAASRGLVDANLAQGLDSLSARLESLLPVPEHPALLHGDLWGGNCLVGPEGEPVVIDPAVYFGHREADLAMTELFGGYGVGFLQAYEETWPLETGFADRVDLYNLYHLLNHANLFGGGYIARVRDIVRRWS